jgi:N-methylhydantoinase A
MKNSTRIAVDIGGTFTDLVAIDETTGEICSAKVPTTPKDLAQGVINAVEKSRINLGECSYFVHGTTVGVNALIQRKGAKTGLITTKGFRDVLEIARMSRDNMYNLWYKRPPPFVPRPLRLEVTERISVNGDVIEPLDISEVSKVIRYLKSHSVESIAVCFLHSYANPKHERMVGDILTRQLPNIPFSLSCVVAREYREYERTNTTVLDAYVKPLMSRYLSRLEQELKTRGFRGRIMIALSSGGMRDALVSTKTPIKVLNSGPVGGVVGTCNIASLLKLRNIIGIDAGGTSFDVSMVIEGKPTLAEQTTIESYPVLVPTIDIKSIGAGGGSIAWIDTGGHLRVGPESAGAEPGPMCYGRGGIKPTVTDAALLLGILDPHYFLGGSLELKPRLAAKGVGELGNTLGMTQEETAAGILSIAKANMAGAIREITVGQGQDPGEFELLSYGGATSMFVCDLASELGISTIIVPREPGNFSAWGMLYMDIIYDYSQTYVSSLTEDNRDTYNKIFNELEEEGSTALKSEGVQTGSRKFIRSMGLRYEWQAHHLQVSVPQGRIDSKLIQNLNQSFQVIHEKNFGHRRPVGVQTVNLRVQAIGILPKPRMNVSTQPTESVKAALKGHRKVWITGAGPVSFEIYDRAKLNYGNKIPGPAIIEEETSTTLIRDCDLAEVDRYENLVLTIY